MRFRIPITHNQANALVIWQERMLLNSWTHILIAQQCPYIWCSNKWRKLDQTCCRIYSKYEPVEPVNSLLHIVDHATRWSMSNLICMGSDFKNSYWKNWKILQIRKKFVERVYVWFLVPEGSNHTKKYNHFKKANVCRFVWNKSKSLVSILPSFEMRCSKRFEFSIGSKLIECK